MRIFALLNLARRLMLIVVAENSTSKLVIMSISRFPPFKGTRHFQVRGKLEPRYVGPFRIIKKVGAVAYQLELPQSLSAVHNVFHISQLKQCHRVPTDAVDLESLDLQPGLTYEEHPIAILDRDERRVKRSMVKFVKVQWSNHSEDEATWEREDQLRQEYPEFFSDE